MHSVPIDFPPNIYVEPHHQRTKIETKQKPLSIPTLVLSQSFTFPEQTITQTNWMFYGNTIYIPPRVPCVTKMLFILTGALNGMALFIINQVDEKPRCLKYEMSTKVDKVSCEWQKGQPVFCLTFPQIPPHQKHQTIASCVVVSVQ